MLFTGGKIAGWTISGTTLLGNNATLDGAGSALFKTDAGPDTDNSAATDELRNEFYIDFTPEGQGNTRNFFVKFGPNFMVDSDGILKYKGAIDDVGRGMKFFSASLKDAINHVATQLDDVKNNKSLTNSSTVAYGCSVKYNYD